jgi:hypothetical protein
MRICMREQDSKSLMQVKTTISASLLLEQGLAYMSGRGIYDGSLDSE